MSSSQAIPRPTAFCKTRKGISASRKAMSLGPPLASSFRFAVSPLQPKNSSSKVGLMLVSIETDTPPQVDSK
ncbi:hypothetical protein G6F68_021796 [Rhizopus microsporus]|nr:hypothetical protein G6F68_021796 [Rhizopus microsporus]